MQSHSNAALRDAVGASLPSVFGDYELAQKLGAGGFATVYLARRTGHDDLCAIKRIHSHYADEPDFMKMFVDEARIARCVSHPNVCAVLDAGEVDGEVYLALEHLMGEPLSRVGRALMRRSARMGIHERLVLIAKIVAAAADGLHAAHEAIDADGSPLWVVHRDVAPQNIFVCYDGTVRVMDFGCATAAGRLFHTAAGTARGHIDFIAPEQLRADAVDRRADVWALGVALWQLTTGRTLFRRESHEATMFAITRDRAPRLRDVDPRIPLRLDNIVAGALEHDLAARTATARELSEQLDEFVRATTVQMETQDVAERMDALFPGGSAAQHAIVSRARDVLEATYGAAPSGWLDSIARGMRDRLGRRASRAALAAVTAVSRS